MQELYWNRDFKYPNREIFSQLQVPPDATFFARLDGRFAMCLVASMSARLHKSLFNRGINLTQTPAWQPRGNLVYKEPYQRQIKNHSLTRFQIKENWNLPLFSLKDDQDLIHQILEWAKSQCR